MSFWKQIVMIAQWVIGNRSGLPRNVLLEADCDEHVISARKRVVETVQADRDDDAMNFWSELGWPQNEWLESDRDDRAINHWYLLRKSVGHYVSIKVDYVHCSLACYFLFPYELCSLSVGLLKANRDELAMYQYKRFRMTTQWATGSESG